MSPRILRAIDVFLDAINNGTLAKGDCTMCAVGNLCGGDDRWAGLFFTNSMGEQYIHQHSLYPAKDGYEAIKKTEFSEKELAKIEYAFETNTKIPLKYYYFYSKEAIRADQINGLNAVVKVMMEFDDCKESVEEVFTKRAELIPV